MSERMDNINKTSEEAFSEEIKRLLESSEYLEKKPSLDQFKVMVYKERKRKRKKRMAAVASIAVVLIAGLFAFETIAPEVESDLTPMEEKKTENGVIIENRGWGSYVEEGDQTVITEWDEVEKVAKSYPQFMIPKYVPEGYKFELMTAEAMGEEDVILKYIFVNKKKVFLEIEIISFKGGKTSIAIDNVDKKLDSQKGTIYCQKEEEKATIQFDDGYNGYILNIWYKVSEQKLVKIVDAIE